MCVFYRLVLFVVILLSSKIINVFLVTTIAGTILDTISDIVEKPTATFTLLGESLPKVCRRCQGNSP